MPQDNAKEQILAKISESKNILLALSNNPSIDELSTALALTIALNKAGKQATAVASGKIPDVLNFLNPDKTFESTVDSLRDFIISFKKEKGDSIRYKAVGEYVKIFLKPSNKNTISEKDLEFEQGDFNVDFVLAIGVADKNNLDQALVAHGRIFHDASVGVLTAGNKTSKFSGINWHNENAGSLSETALEIIESDIIGSDKLDRDVSTAILTGIIAETERFSNAKTTAKVMSVASKLIIAGADQQLIVSKIKEAEEKATVMDLRDGQNSKATKNVEQNKPKEEKSFVISHSEKINFDDEISQDIKKLEDLAPGIIESSTLDKSLEKLKQSQNIQQQKVEPISDEIFSQNPESVEKTDVVDFSNFENKPKVNFKKKIQPAFTEAPKNAEDSFENELASLRAMPEFKPDYIESPIPEPKAFEPEVISPNIAKRNTPEIPQPIASVDFNKAFISESPVSGSQFESAPKVNIQPTQRAEISHHNNGLMSRTPEIKGDEYYNPENNMNILSAISQPEIDKKNELANNFNNIPQKIAPDVQIQSEPQQAPQQFGGFPPPMPPLPDFGAMMPPELPPIPDFVQPQSEPIKPAEVANSPVVSEQIYPDVNNPRQFKIPGM